MEHSVSGKGGDGIMSQKDVIWMVFLVDACRFIEITTLILQIHASSRSSR